MRKVILTNFSVKGGIVNPNVYGLFGHLMTMDNFSIVGREGHGFTRTMKD